MYLTELAPATAYDTAAVRVGDRYLRWMGWVLVGYAFMNKGFAYLGFPPVYIGEITLLFGLIALNYSHSSSRILSLTPAKVLVAVMLWGAICTIPHIPTYRINSLRDAVLWGYGLFAFITAGLLIDQPERLKTLLLRYRKFALAFLATIWIIFLARRLGILRLPTVPGTSVPLVVTLGGPVMVHVAGAAAFVLVGMVRRNLRWFLLIAVNFFVIGLINRGGMVAFIMAMLVIVSFRLPTVKLGSLYVGVFVIILALAIINPTVEVSKGRSINLDQLTVNLESIFSDDEISGQNVDNTKDFRLDWWRKIVGYTFGGEYFWTGKGFGINLAIDDDVVKEKDFRKRSPNRSPHNSHMSILARAGVPGFCLWLFLQLTWFCMLARRFLLSKREGDYEWSGVFLFLIAYWIAFLVEASFSVSLEGPMLGIWFWTLFGVGLAAAYIHQFNPDVIRP